VDAGVSAISVSNHGGNNLDGTPATIRALPAVAAAVGDQVEVLLDGGVRRGSDVVKALALGARAVMIGRAYLWGLAANGQAGVENVLDIMGSGIDSALLGLGRSAVAELSPADLVIPPGFDRRLGEDGLRVPWAARVRSPGGPPDYCRSNGWAWRGIRSRRRDHRGCSWAGRYPTCSTS
jgi:pre-mycofactocin synthase